MSRTTNKARDLLVKQDLRASKPFMPDIPRMRFDEEIIFDTFQNYARITGVPLSEFSRIKDGCTIIKGNLHIILVHDCPTSALHRSNSGTGAGTLSYRNNWTLAHEVGHVLLGHSIDGSEEEIQANAFASELLMPELLMLELKRRLKRDLLPREISRLFGVSQNAAENRLAQIERKCCFSAYLKNEIMEKYKTAIDDYVNGAYNRAVELLF